MEVQPRRGAVVGLDAGDGLASLGIEAQHPDEAVVADPHAVGQRGHPECYPRSQRRGADDPGRIGLRWIGWAEAIGVQPDQRNGGEGDGQCPHGGQPPAAPERDGARLWQRRGLANHRLDDPVRRLARGLVDQPSPQQVMELGVVHADQLPLVRRALRSSASSAARSARSA